VTEKLTSRKPWVLTQYQLFERIIVSDASDKKKTCYAEIAFGIARASRPMVNLSKSHSSWNTSNAWKLNYSGRKI